MFRTFSLLCLLMTLIAVLLGAGARISDAGMGCPEWPGCYGRLIMDEPLQAMTHAVDARTPSASHAAWANAHRYAAMALSIASVMLLLSLLRYRGRLFPVLGMLVILIPLLVGLAWMGQARLEFKQIALVETLQLCGGMLAVGFWAALYFISKASDPVVARQPKAGWTLRWAVAISLPALFIEIALGGWVSAQFAGLACQDFPACMGTYLPDTHAWPDAFTFWRGLDAELFGAVLSPEARAVIQWTHRIGALLCYLLLAGIGISLSSSSASASLSKSAVALNFLLLIQIALGMASVLMRLPLIIVLAHTAVSALLVINLVYIVIHLPWVDSVLAPTPVPAPGPGDVDVSRSQPPEARFYGRLREQLAKTRKGFAGLFIKSDSAALQQLEAQLLMADVGVHATRLILEDLEKTLAREQGVNPDRLRNLLKARLLEILSPCSIPLNIPANIRPFVILVVGVNGAGKTTTIGKLAKRLQLHGHSVMLAAGDTFRAAAVEQLQTWGERNQIPVIAQSTGADSASVIFDAVQAAQARGVDVLIADTAGRLHTKSNLMEELSKIKRIMGRLDPQAPHEVLLVLDAGTGQNALSQAQLFSEAVGLTGLALTKLDGTARGGVIFALAQQSAIPIRFIGIGEGIDDLRDFDAEQFVDALFTDEAQ